MSPAPATPPSLATCQLPIAHAAASSRAPISPCCCTCHCNRGRRHSLYMVAQPPLHCSLLPFFLPPPLIFTKEESAEHKPPSPPSPIWPHPPPRFLRRTPFDSPLVEHPGVFPDLPRPSIEHPPRQVAAPTASPPRRRWLTAPAHLRPCLRRPNPPRRRAVISSTPGRHTPPPARPSAARTALLPPRGRLAHVVPFCPSVPAAAVSIAGDKCTRAAPEHYLSAPSLPVCFLYCFHDRRFWIQSYYA